MFSDDQRGFIFSLCRNQEVEVLKGQVEVLERCILKEKEKADDLETKAK